MDPELRELYQDLILDHGRQPRNFGPLPGYSHRLEGVNPLCGDKLVLYLKVVDDRIEDISFEGAGCAISMASASLMTERLRGRSVDEAMALFDPVHRLLMTGELRPAANSEPGDENLGKVRMLAGVSAFPSRVKCATLAWHTLRAALSGESKPVSTE